MRSIIALVMLAGCLIVQAKLSFDNASSSFPPYIKMIDKIIKEPAKSEIREENLTFDRIPATREVTFLVTSVFWFNLIGKTITETTDGGYMIGGELILDDNHFIFLMKHDASGVVIWTDVIVLEGTMNGEAVQQTADGGFIVVGTTASGEILLVQYDPEGSVDWVRTVRGDASTTGNSVKQTADGGYIVVGSIDNGSTGDEVFLLRISNEGDVEWAKATNLVQSIDSGEYTVEQTLDGGYIVAGSSLSDVLLLKFDSLGSLEWARTAGGSGGERCNAIHQTTEGGYIVAGETASYGVGDYDALLLRYDASGNLVWARTTGGGGADHANCVRQTTDGGYIVAGDTASFGAGACDVFLVKYDTDGNLVWARIVDRGNSDYGNSIQQTADGGYVVTGSSASDGALQTFLMKVDANGFIRNCPEVQTCLPEATTPSISCAVPQITTWEPQLRVETPTMVTTAMGVSYNVDCGNTPPPTPLPTPVILIPTKMNILFRAQSGSPPDYFTTTASSDLPLYLNDGQKYYIPSAAPPASTNRSQVLYRLKKDNSLNPDDMDSLNPNEGAGYGYQCKLSLGRTWNASDRLEGTKAIRRYHNPTTGDHATGSLNDPIGLMGYTDECGLGYGYRRYDKAGVVALPLTNGRIDDLVTIQSNLAAGGAIWEWTWNGMQFINDHDYGRSIQTTLWFRTANPTEAGDRYSYQNLLPAMRHGSPVLEAVNEEFMQRTIAMPLEYNLDNFGGDRDHPLLYESVRLGKEITLYWNNMARVAQYDTLIYAPTTLDLEGLGNIQVPWVALRALFSRFYRFNEHNLWFQEITSEVMSCRCFDSYRWYPQGDSERFGGLLVSTADGNYAFGILIDIEQESVTSAGGRIQMAAFYYYDCPEYGFGQETGKFDNPTTVPIALYRGRVLGPGFTSFRSYLFCGTLAQVQSDLIIVYTQLAE